MKKIISSLLATGVSYTFSFYKMCDVMVHENTDGYYIKIDNNQLDPNKRYCIYAYDPNLKYGLINYIYRINDPYLFHILKTKNFKEDEWEELYSIMQRIFLAFYFSLDLLEHNSINKIHDEIKIPDFNKNKIEFFTNTPLYLDSPLKYRRNSIAVELRSNGVNLILPDGKCPLKSTGKKIDFERALKNYVRSQQEFRKKNFLLDDNLNQHVTELAKEKNTNESRHKSAFSIKKMDKFTYTDDQIKLLKNSTILAIWALPSKYYNNEEYIKDWNSRHPKDPKTPEYKQINRIIIGYAVDNRTNETFNFVTDLGQDISVLFNYDY